MFEVQLSPVTSSYLIEGNKRQTILIKYLKKNLKHQKLFLKIKKKMKHIFVKSFPDYIKKL